MNNNDKSVMYGWIAVILGLALIVVAILWISARNDLESRTEEFQEDLVDYRAEIAETCTFTATTTEAQREECKDLLEEFKDILEDYNEVLEETPATTTIPTSTTTTTGGAM